jgi:hypothetical protein
MADYYTVTLTNLECHMAVLAVDNMKDDEDNPTRRRALLRLHAKLITAKRAARKVAK